jgi:YD repeat-containing protein
VTKLTYDGGNQLFVQSIDGGPTTYYRHDGQGRVVQTATFADPDFRITSFDYDNDGRITRMTVDPKATIDGVGQPSFDSNALNIATTYTYDSEGRTVTMTEGAGSVGPRTTQYSYDVLGRRIQEIVDPGTGHLNFTTQYKYDANGNVIRKIDATGSSTWYIYDAKNRLTFTIDALGEVSETTYDAEDRVIAIRDYLNPVNVANFTVAGVTADLVTVTRTNPSASAVLQVVGGTAMTVSSGAGDDVTQTVYDKDGRAVYSIDAMGTVTERTFDPNSPNALVTRTRVYANQISSSAAYTTVTSVQAALGTSVNTIAAGDVLTWNAYDERGRLAFTVNGVGDVVQYQYDGNNDIVSQTAYATPRPTNLATDFASLTSWATTAAIANNTQNQTVRYAYNAAGKLLMQQDAQMSIPWGR